MTDPVRPSVETCRYCPMCNRVTAIERTEEPPFYALMCRECGHVHRISEAREPIVLPFWRYCR